MGVFKRRGIVVEWGVVPAESWFSHLGSREYWGPWSEIVGEAGWESGFLG